jgi:hypothetical protein
LVLEKYTRRPAPSATALALAVLLAGEHTTQATQPPPVAAKPAAATKPAATTPAAAPTSSGDLIVVEGGRAVGQTTPEAARHDGLTVVDLSDDWLPFIFSEEPGKPQPLRPYLIDLANERLRKGGAYAKAREDRFFEAFGIPPSPSVLRRRLADRKRHACHDRVKDSVLETLSAKNVIPAEEAEKVPCVPAVPGAPPPPPGGTPAPPGGTPAPPPGASPPQPPAKPVCPPREPGEPPVTMVMTGRTISPRPLTAVEKRAVVAMQAHLRCEDLLSGKANAGRMDRRTSSGLEIYQRLNMVADSGRIDFDTRTVLLADSREQDFRALLRALRARVVDATGLLEDGSALGVVGQVQGRMLDSPEFQPLSGPATPAPATPAPATPGAATPGAATPGAPATAATTPAPAPAPPAGQSRPDAPALKITPAPDLIAAATQAASQALGWASPEAALASAGLAPPPSKRPGRKAPARTKGPAPLPVAVAIRLPPLPAYHGPNMDLRAEIDRGEVVLARPKLDKDGKKKWKPPVNDRPTITLYARVGDGEVALARWPTTIGGWKTIQKADGSLALKYKESVTGDALWPEILATPTWHPGGGAQVRHLLVKNGDTWEPKTQIIGPGYRAAYGLVAIVHHQIESVDENGQQQLVDHRIRTHGTPVYRSVKRGESSGCHRLHNHLALRLAGFLVKHHANVRDGLVPEDYERKLEYKGQQVSLLSDNKGYRFKLTPPIKVTVLDGDVKGNAKSVKGMVPMAVAP